MLRRSARLIAAVVYLVVHPVLCVTSAAGAEQCHLEGSQDSAPCKEEFGAASDHSLISTKFTRATVVSAGPSSPAAALSPAAGGHHEVGLVQGNSSKADYTCFVVINGRRYGRGCSPGEEPAPTCGQRSRENCAPSGRDCYWSGREERCKVKEERVSCGIYGSHKYNYRGPGCAACPDYGPEKDYASNCNGDCYWSQGTCLKKGAAWGVKSGPCSQMGDCIRSPNYPYQYNNSQRCEIIVAAGNTKQIWAPAFTTEAGYDKLTVNGRQYSGLSPPVGIVPAGSITWVSDGSIVKSGWELCLREADATEATWSLKSGPCSQRMECISSPNYPANYGDNQKCEITVPSGNTNPISVKAFWAEDGHDKLSVNGREYTGRSSPQGVVPTGSITWSSDHGATRDGWQMCLEHIDYVGCLGPTRGWVRPYGDVDISADGAAQCKQKCHDGGYTYFGLECPMATGMVHCQCNNVLGGESKPDEFCEGRGEPLLVSWGHSHCVGPYVKDGFRFGDYYVGATYRTGYKYTHTNLAAWVGCLGHTRDWTRKYGDVSISATGALQCKDLCRNGGYKYFGLECPMRTGKVHCQCSSALGGDQKSIEYCEGAGNPLLNPNGHSHCVGPYVMDGFRFGDYWVGATYLAQ